MKKLAIIFLSFFFAFFNTGCVVQEKVKKLATDWKAEGREYGKGTKTFSRGWISDCVLGERMRGRYGEQ